MKLRKNRLLPLRLDLSAALIPESGIDRTDLERLYPRLEAIRDAIVQDDLEMQAGKSSTPGVMQPPDTRFISMPERLLSEYEADRRGSELGRLFRMATKLHAMVDRVVVLGVNGSTMGARALMDSCCQPHWNELSRADRGSRPRMVFEGNNLDNDALQGLLYWLATSHNSLAVSESKRWALVVIDPLGDSLETAIVFKQLLAALQTGYGADTDPLQGLVIPVTEVGSQLHSLAIELGCPEIFPIPVGVSGQFTVFSAVGLVPAALLGINVIELLGGAVELTRHFCRSPASENIVLQHVAVNYLLQKQRGMKIRVMSVWSHALESIGLWYDQLSAESLGPEADGFTSWSLVNPRDRHRHLPRLQPGARGQVWNNYVVDQYRFDSIAIGRHALDLDSRKTITDKTLSDIMAATVATTNAGLREVGLPTTNLHIPRIDELHVGQLLQMLMLAILVEGQLIENI